jgi:hypothetical protein
MLALPRYTVRRHAFEQERTWTIEPTGLSWIGPDRSGHLAFRDIAEVRLAWAGTRADHARYSCEVTRIDGSTETIVSTSYAGPMNFPDQSQTYVPFVRALVLSIAYANPACGFRAGATQFNFWGSIGLMALGLLLLASVLVTIGLPLTGIILAKLIVLAFLVPLGLAWVRRNWPRPLDPDNISQDALPPLTPNSPALRR